MNKIDNILLKSELLDKQDLELKDRETSLAKQSEQSNKVFNSLWNAYDKLGILKEKHSELVPIDRKTFTKELKNIENNYSIKIEALTSKDCTEEFIADFLTLLTSRWNTIQDLKNIWRKRRVDFRKRQIEIIMQLESIDTQSTDSDLKIDDISNLLISNLGEQERLFTVEKEATDEQFKIHEIRKKLLGLASDVF